MNPIITTTTTKFKVKKNRKLTAKWSSFVGLSGSFGDEYCTSLDEASQLDFLEKYPGRYDMIINPCEKVKLMEKLDLLMELEV